MIKNTTQKSIKKLHKKNWSTIKLGKTQQKNILIWGFTFFILNGISYIIIYSQTKHVIYSTVASIVASLLIIVLIKNVRKTLLKDVDFLGPKALFQFTMYTIIICVIIASISVGLDLSLKFLINIIN